MVLGTPRKSSLMPNGIMAAALAFAGVAAVSAQDRSAIFWCEQRQQRLRCREPALVTSRKIHHRPVAAPQ